MSLFITGEKLVKTRHPTWLCNAENWRKWRITYRGGDDFIEEYVKKFSNLEDNTDFRNRKLVTPSASFAKSVVNEIKNSIFQRMSDIQRKGGPDSYKMAVEGQNFGVDLHGTSMNTFMGREVLPELLTMAKVGIWVDMPPVTGPTFVDSTGKSPYLYVYKAEEILSWAYRRDRIEEFQSVLLIDYIDQCDEETGLPHGTWKRHRLAWIGEDGRCHVMAFNEEGNQIDLEGNPSNEDYIIDLPYIPFLTLELTDSLLTDVSNHQIALVNMESADMVYTLKSNYPIYTEQVDDRDFSQYLKGPANVSGQGTQAEATAGPDQRETKVGNSVGRRYRSGLERPGFINPSSEPVRVSMEKQKAVKDDLRQLVHLALSNIKPKMASAESKAIDERGLESGLSYIGLELERGERQIAKIWSDYEKSNDPAVVKYPQKWSLQTEDDRRKDAEHLEELRDVVPSTKFQKEVSKQIVAKMMGDKIGVEVLEEINKEIDSAETITADPEIIFKGIETGTLDKKRAAKILGWPEQAVEDAAKEHAERLAAIAKAQSVNRAPGARGMPDQSVAPKEDAKGEKAESRDTTKDGVVTDKTRGEGQ